MPPSWIADWSRGTWVLMAVGGALALIVPLAARRRRPRTDRRPQDTTGRLFEDLAAVRSVVELMAMGEDEDVVLITAAFWLRELLGLRDCRFDRSVTPRSPARIESGGAVVLANLQWDAERHGLPGEDVDLPLRADGEPFARFVLRPTPATPLPLDRLVTAAAVADLVATWLHLRQGDPSRRAS